MNTDSGAVIQRTCGELVVLRGAGAFCGEPASFHYSGTIRPRPGLTLVHTLERFGRIEKDLCLQHSRETFINMEPALRDGTATMRCLEFTKLTLRCTKCNSIFRFEPLRPVMVRSSNEQSPAGNYFPIPNHYCPVCGAQAVAEYNPALDYWEIIAAKLDLPVSLTVQIYSHWMKDAQASAKFIEYIQQILAELDTE